MKNQNFQVRHNDTIIRLVIQRLQKPYIHPSKGNCADNTYSSKGIEAIQQNTHYAASQDQRGKTLKKFVDKTLNHEKLYGLSHNESILHFTPSYQHPKEDIKFPNFDILDKADELYLDEDFDNTIFRDLKKTLINAQQIIQDERNILDNSSKTALVETSQQPYILKQFVIALVHTNKNPYNQQQN